MKKALQVTVDNEFRILDIEENSLKTLQEGVGGYIQPVDYGNELTMWTNEEGKLNGSILNPIGSLWWNTIFPDHFDLIFGDVVFTGGTDDEGDTLGLSDESIETLTAMFTSWIEA